jgi:hypothetical protein
VAWRRDDERLLIFQRSVGSSPQLLLPPPTLSTSTMDGVQMSQPTSGAYYTQQQSNIVVSPTSVSGGVGEVLSNTERTLQRSVGQPAMRSARSRQETSRCSLVFTVRSLSWKHSLYVHDFCWCCCKREVKRFELEVSSERVTNVITEFSKACCSDPVPTVSYETVYLPHVVGMSMGHAVLQSGR